MEYSPPPLFKQGASARAKVIIFTLIAIALLVVDARFRTLNMIRQGVGVVLYPLQVVALLPRDAVYAVGEYFYTQSSLQRENRNLKAQQVANARALQEGRQLIAENAQLRKLMGASERLPVKSIMSEILYDTRDSFTRKIVLDRGTHHGIQPGQPVIDDVGVVGQVTRVFPFTSEVTLLTDKDHAISTQVLRSGLRSVAYGKGQSGVLELRFMATNADIRKGDVLVTSGIDGVYPAGLMVATVSQVEHKSSDAFARIVLQPTAGIDRNKQLLILLPEAKFPPRPEPEETFDKKDKKKKAAAKDAKEGKDAKDSDKAAKTGQEGAAKPAAPATPTGNPDNKPMAPGAAGVLPAAAVKAAPAKDAKAAAAAAVPAPARTAAAPATAAAPSPAPAKPAAGGAQTAPAAAPGAAAAAKPNANAANNGEAPANARPAAPAQPVQPNAYRPEFPATPRAAPAQTSPQPVLLNAPAKKGDDR